MGNKLSQVLIRRMITTMMKVPITVLIETAKRHVSKIFLLRILVSTTITFFTLLMIHLTMTTVGMMPSPPTGPEAWFGMELTFSIIK
jgi:hypothetical protein